MSRLRLPVLLLGLVWLALRLPAALAMEVPYLTGRITDEAEILSPEARRQIGARLQAHEEATSDQVAVLTIPSLEGEGIEEFALRVFDAWQLGRKGKDNGVLLVVAPGDRRMRIEVGYGLEGHLTDLEAGRIVRGIMAPRFKAEDFDGGVAQGVEAILAQLSGDDAPLPEATDASPRRESFFQGPDLPIVERLLFGAFIFGIIGLFTVIGVLTPGVGWFLYFFLIPFWAMFPTVVLSPSGTLTLLVVYLVAYPLVKVWLARRPWYRQARQELLSKGRATIGGFSVSSGGRSGSGFWSSSGGGGFSGGGGRSGGGGSSGSW
jgi:uncharacterized protein